MRKLLVVLAAVAGCSGNGHGHITLIDAFHALDTPIADDDAPPDGQPGTPITTTATWAFEGVSGTGSTTITAHACPTGGAVAFDTAAIISQAAAADGSVTGTCNGMSTTGAACVVDLWDCIDYTGTSAIETGTWSQFVSITDHAGATVYADTIPQLGTLAADNALGTYIVDNGGYVNAQWSIHHGGSAVACSTVAGATGVDLVLPGAGAMHFACDAGADFDNFSAPYVAGTFATSVNLVNSQGATLASSTSASSTITAPNGVTLATYVIDVP